MAERLERWPMFGLREVHEMAESGMSARQIARQTGAPLGSILSAAPECFQTAEVREGHEFCEGCGRRLTNTSARRCRACCSSEWRELADRARVLQATGAGLAEMARELEVTEGKVRWALKIATREGLHRQKRPTVTRR